MARCRRLGPENLWEMGIGTLVIARSISVGQWACGIFLVDVYCLGVKDALWKIITPGEFESLRQDCEAHGQFQETAPEHFAKLVYRAADYGQSLGFSAHRDFRHVQRLLAGIDPSQCADEFQFGRNGRPMYIRGPSESLEQAQSIAARVDSLGGHYTVMLGPKEVPPEFEAFADWDEDDEFETYFEMTDEDADDDDDDGDEPAHEPRRRSWMPRLPWR